MVQPHGRSGLERLAEKYRLLAELRSRREEVEARGGHAFTAEENAERTSAFATVAQEFPGALREMEHSTREELEQRGSAVGRVLARGGDGAEAPEWMAVVIEYHDTLREALAIKMWLAGAVATSGETTPVLLERFREWHRSHPARHTPTERFDRELLETYRRPPGGRLHSIVWDRLARCFGRGRGELESLVFHPPAGS
jgi:hypothetical protein